jgi:Uma2 family endonuclease
MSTTTTDIVVAGEDSVPDWVVDFATFNRWTDSTDFPETGRFSFIHGKVWADLSMEQLFSHNRLKVRITSVLETIVTALAMGYVFSDGARLRNIDTELSVEPDLFFVTFGAVQSGRIVLSAGRGDGFLYVDGAPELVVEILSDSSEHKDLEALREGYFDAGITEYWLIDARRNVLAFDVLQRAQHDFEAVSAGPDGWIRSSVFGKSFRITQTADPLGHPQFTLEHRD